MEQIQLELTKLAAQMGGFETRLDKLEKLTESVHSLALSLREMTTKVEILSDDVIEIKTKPQKRWDAVIASLISAIIGALVAYFLKT